MLQDSAVALRTEARAQRNALNDRFEKQRTDTGIERDRAARDEFASDQGAKSADQQVKKELKEAKAFREEEDDFGAKARVAEQKGNTTDAEELNEIAGGHRRSAAAADARVQAAQRDAADLRVKAAEHHRDVVDAEQRLDKLSDESFRIEKQIDLLEDQSRLVDAAAVKLTRADALEGAGDAKSVNEIAKLRSEADQLFDQAQNLEIDTADIASVTGRPVEVPNVLVGPVATTEAEDLDLVGDSGALSDDAHAETTSGEPDPDTDATAAASEDAPEPEFVSSTDESIVAAEEVLPEPEESFVDEPTDALAASDGASEFDTGDAVDDFSDPLA